MLHGLGCWFTVDFLGSDAHVTLSTAPDAPGTHWYQCRLLLPTPIAVNASQTVSGNLHFVANTKFSYDIEMEGTWRDAVLHAGSFGCRRVVTPPSFSFALSRFSSP